MQAQFADFRANLEPFVRRLTGPGQVVSEAPNSQKAHKLSLAVSVAQMSHWKSPSTGQKSKCSVTCGFLKVQIDPLRLYVHKMIPSSTCKVSKLSTVAIVVSFWEHWASCFLVRQLPTEKDERGIKQFTGA